MAIKEKKQRYFEYFTYLKTSINLAYRPSKLLDYSLKHSFTTLLLNDHHQRWWLEEEWPLKEAILLRVILLYPFVLFLVFYISPYLLFVHPYCRDTVAPTPEMVAPIRLLLELMLAFEQRNCRLPFQYPHQL